MDLSVNVIEGGVFHTWDRVSRGFGENRLLADATSETPPCRDFCRIGCDVWLLAITITTLEDVHSAPTKVSSSISSGVWSRGVYAHP